MSMSTLKGYRYEQVGTSASWVITHNLGTNAPVMDIWVDVVGTMTKIIPQSVVGTDTKVATITFSTPYEGVAYVS